MNDDEKVQKLDVSLALLCERLTQHIERQAEVNSHLMKLCDAHARFIHGDGRPGAEVRLDRIEQREIFRDRVLLSMVGALIVLVVEAAWNALFS